MHRSLPFVSALLPLAAFAWTPGSVEPEASTGLAVDITQRNDVAAFYQCIFAASAGTAGEPLWLTGMEGSIIDCIPGVTLPSYQENVLRRINYYRAMAGLPASVSFTGLQNAKAQAAALATSANAAANHLLESSAACFSLDAQEGAEQGNLVLGLLGADAVDWSMESLGGSDPTLVRYRRWILQRTTSEMGTGDFPAQASNPAAHSLFVSGTTNPSVQPADPRENFAFWPPGKYHTSTGVDPVPSPDISYVPADIVSPRWSLQFGDANSPQADGGPAQLIFINATISMKIGNGPLTSVASARIYGRTSSDSFDKIYGGPAIVWDPDWSGTGGTPPLNTPIRVDVRGLTNFNEFNHISYTVVLIDPAVLTDTFAISGDATPDAASSAYTFLPASAPGASAYDLRVHRVASGGKPAFTNVTPLPGEATGFTLDATTAGVPLAEGDTFEISIRPTIQGHTFGYGQVFSAAIAQESTLASWFDASYPSVPASERDFTGNPDGDENSNGIEYAFGLDPTDPSDAPPTFTLGEAGAILTFDPAARGYDTPDVEIRLMTSPDLFSWTELVPTASGSELTYTIPPSAGRTFVQWAVSEVPAL